MMTIRVIVVAVLAAAGGSLVTFLAMWNAPSSNVLVERVLHSAVSEPDRKAPAAVPQRIESVAARRAAAYRFAAQADFSTLTELIAEAARSSTRQRSGLVEALLLRAVELDPVSSVELLSTVDLEPKRATGVALLLLEALGIDAGNIVVVAAALPDRQARDFRIEALTLWTEAAPEQALLAAFATEPLELRARAVQSVAQAWSERDSGAALAEARLLEDHPMGLAFVGAVLASPATDPAALIDFVNGSEVAALGRNQLIGAVMQRLSGMERLAALRMASSCRATAAT